MIYVSSMILRFNTYIKFQNDLTNIIAGNNSETMDSLYLTNKALLCFCFTLNPYILYINKNQMKQQIFQLYIDYM